MRKVDQQTRIWCLLHRSVVVMRLQFLPLRSNITVHQKRGTLEGAPKSASIQFVLANISEIARIEIASNVIFDYLVRGHVN